MRLFGGREPLVDPDTGARAAWDAAGIHGLQRLRRWDAVETVEAQGLDGDESRFVVLGSGDVVVEEGPDGVAPLSAAVARQVAPPYRAEAIRRDGNLWVVAALAIELVDLPGVAGDEIELTVHGGHRTLLVDGERTSGTIAALERPEHVVRATRIDRDTWEVSFDRL
jgi:hypothetical protein